MIAFSHECSDESSSRRRTKKEQKEIDKKWKRIRELREKMETIFKESCYIKENGWVKPNDLDSIMKRVISKTIDYLREKSLL